MLRQIGLLSSVAFYGMVAAANAASPFDGTYQFSSSAKVSETHINTQGDMGTCPGRQPGPFTVVNGQARYTTETGRQFEGMVGPRGEIDLRFIEPSGGAEMHTIGAIAADGTVQVRQKGGSCSYDFVWRKQP
jgi:hypothetical protein